MRNYKRWQAPSLHFNFASHGQACNLIMSEPHSKYTQAARHTSLNNLCGSKVPCGRAPSAGKEEEEASACQEEEEEEEEKENDPVVDSLPAEGNN